MPHYSGVTKTGKDSNYYIENIHCRTHGAIEQWRNNHLVTFLDPSMCLTRFEELLWIY